ncbi:GPR1/FUN34/YaaH family transporter [Amycolatopsis sp. NPDC051903]|uniref:GPR1/FUN34/YaaH family transporter n=1 Tax=Amycolatopsis sp. NPDC051903 TaxID=3363936 RepID=UPI0037B3D084
MSEPAHPAVAVRPYASPLPLGFFCFGIGMALLGGIGLGLVDGDQLRTAGILLAAFVFPLEFLAAVMAFLARDTGAAAALGLFATSWLGLGVVYVVAPQQHTSVALGFYLGAFAIALVPLIAVAFLGKALLGIVLTVSALRAALSAAYQFGAPAVVERAGGWVAFAIFALALYAGTAFLIEDVRQRTTLPILRRSTARQALEGDLSRQTARLPHEAGVRNQL